MEIIIFIIPIAVVLFFVIQGLTKSKINNKNKRVFNSILGAILIAPVLYGVFIISLLYLFSFVKSQTFVQEKWMLATEEENGRYEMADDLINRKILIANDSIKVKEILGEPEYRNKLQNTWFYYLGFGGGIGFTDYELQVIFANNKVIEVKHIRIRD